MFAIDRLLRSMVKVVESNQKKISGSGFLIRPDGYLITCHHVICSLNELNVFYNDKLYEAKWCEDLSNPEVDISILKIEISDGGPVDIVHPRDFSSEAFVCGFPYSESDNFTHGFDSHPQYLRPSALITTLSTYDQQKMVYTNPWNKLPQENSEFRPLRIPQKLNPGFSGGPVFSEKLGGAIAIIQSTKGDNSYAIRWDNITEILKKLGLHLGQNGRYSLSETGKSWIIKYFNDSEYEPRTKELIFSIEKKATFNRYLVENTILDYAMKIFSGLYFGKQDTREEKLKLDPEAVDFAVAELKNLSVSSSQNRFTYIYENLDEDVKGLLDYDLFNCRFHMQRILCMEWHETKKYIEEQFLNKEPTRPGLLRNHPDPYNLFRIDEDFVMSKKGVVGDPLYFYYYHSDGFLSSLRFLAVWSGYQTYRRSLEFFARKEITYNRCAEVYHFILSDFQVSRDKQKEYLARMNISENKIRKLLVWYLAGEIKTGMSIYSTLKEDYEPLSVPYP